ncbi:hypothetical protein YTPLAS73_14300 [Nitrosarchaeum sp.]|nr:hypothetical protein YTPLAS73_14300 [Nitrosarchaeum sp.]
MVLVPYLVEFFQNPIISVAATASAFGIGIFQGIILGRAILLRFPRLQNHVKIVSVSLFFLFLANAILSVPRFASTEKIDVPSIFQANNFGEVSSLIFLVFGLNVGFLAVLAISVTVIIFVLLKFANLHGAAKIFVFFFSLLILSFTGLSRFTDLTPSTFEIFLYFLYNVGITIGILAGSIRKLKSRKIDWG